MGEILARTIRRARTMAGQTQQDVAKAVGVSRAAVGQWETNLTVPSMDKLKALCQHLNMPFDSIARKMGDWGWGNTERDDLDEWHKRQYKREFGAEQPQFDLDESKPEPRRPSDISVYRVRDAGEDADFRVERTTVDFVRRPPGLNSARRLYALHVVGNRMSPRFEEGDLIFVTDARPPSVGEYCLVYLKNGDDAPGHNVLLLRLTERAGDLLKFQRFNPRGEITLAPDGIAAVDRVIPTHELLER